MLQGERVREIRKYLKMTMEAFGYKVGVQKSAISKIEKGEVNLTDQMAKSICREFNVNYDYLIYGKGEMFSNVPQTVLDELCRQYDCDNLDRCLIESYLKLNAAERQTIKKYINNIFESNAAATAAPKEVQQTTEELEAEYKKSISSSAKKTGYTASSTTDGRKGEKAVG